MLLAIIPTVSSLGGMLRISYKASLLRRSAMSMSSKTPAPNVKRLVLVRHGEVDLAMFNGKKCYYGGVDIPLSAKGRDEAQAAATYLAEKEEITLIWTSPLSRAVFGAERIADVQKVDGVVRHDGFREVDRGDWVGLSEAEIGAETLSKWNKGPDFAPSGGGEALATVAKRVLAARDELLASAPPGSTTCLVSHMWVTRSIVADALGLDTENDTSELQTLDLPTASISVVEYTIDEKDGKTVTQKSVTYVGRKPSTEASAGDKWGG